MKCVMIATGGTGGHINPALSFAKELESRCKGISIIFVGSKNRLESQWIPQEGYPFIGLAIVNTHGSFLHKIAYGFSLIKAYWQCRKLINENKPDAVVGFGNYISVPLLLAGHHLHIPTMISEQNSFAGKANVFLGKFADAIELSYESSLKDFPVDKCRVLGNPSDEQARNTPYDSVLLKSYGLSLEKPYVAIMMGSLGSSSVSKVVEEALTYFDDSFEVLISVGKSNDYSFSCNKENVHILEYVDGKKVLKGASLCVCRAGATTLCEITAMGVPAVLIPSPYVPNHHQEYNAKQLVENNAAVLLLEKDLNAKTLADIVNRLMKKEDTRKAMHDASLQLSKKDCALNMVNWLQEIIHE